MGVRATVDLRRWDRGRAAAVGESPRTRHASPIQVSFYLANDRVFRRWTCHLFSLSKWIQTQSESDVISFAKVYRCRQNSDFPNEEFRPSTSNGCPGVGDLLT